MLFGNTRLQAPNQRLNLRQLNNSKTLDKLIKPILSEYPRAGKYIPESMCVGPVLIANSHRLSLIWLFSINSFWSYPS